ncbi:MAG TPA: Holliday junction branch migration protein RuvA [Candidatus Pacearchaeota archaeon]|nr:Holliday junction branch migration protein RuvA [Candidatus Pacearchaeota archaeon]HRR94830.1 Holliday junction branch migration protein RuvA [Candidatus Paceibacterota bacterium]HPC30621.1 Holliday junction branch migration protein RuvA [Candidatus Pacearchaeota archaeon]HQG09518.1 Holliday junction branch migration protein RuvA [Candidatus Pacearchaeota archaeon]HQH20234.1 Holliday junction branch migration protein RuvA [Candidatus Pacearchaeota archaeon]
MLSYLAGKIIHKDDKKIILERGGFGFEVFLANLNLDQINLGDEVHLYTYLLVGEKTMELYGCLTEAEMELFKTLKAVSGVGAKTALQLASLGSIEKLKQALESGEMPPEVKGVGAKKLQKILLELTGKIEEIKKNKTSLDDEAIKALSELGFNRSEIIQALQNVSPDIKNLEDRLREALKYLAK